MGGGGGVPPSRQKAVIGVFEHFPKLFGKFTSQQHAPLDKDSQSPSSKVVGALENEGPNLQGWQENTVLTIEIFLFL